MGALIALAAVLQSIGTSLGVGGSTLAIINFFVAIADGKIDESERNMMGVVYVVLRVAMGIILLTTMFIGIQQYTLLGSTYFTPFIIAYWVTVIILYTNAILMTMHIMPSTFGPAIQASTWYTLGTITALVPLGLTKFSLLQFVISYLCAVALAVAIVNGMMAHLKKKRQPPTPGAQ